MNMKKVLIAGASGFIGMALIERLLRNENLEIVALSRHVQKSNHPRVIWKKCDLFSLKDISEAMDGCDEAYYLVHSMLPSASLSQGTFYDFDLIVADNFVRAALKFKLRHIIYLGGMIPPDVQLSWHLKSRLEVETLFRNSGITTTVFRAGLIIGPKGSSFTILQRLVERLPIMVCPKWTRTKSQPAALQDVMNVLERALIDEKVRGKIYDIGGPEILTYQDLIILTSKLVKKSGKPILTLSIIPLSVSRFWVKLVTGMPKNLIYPLVLSLRHEMIATPDHAWPYPEDLSTTLHRALEIALRDHLVLDSTKLAGYVPAQKDVRSVQRLVLPAGKNAEWVASEYFSWLPSIFATLIKVQVSGEWCTFYFIHTKIKILILKKNSERSTPDRQLLYVVGGLLSGKQDRGRLEFREVLDKKYVMAALHEFRPALPWYIYRWSQAVVHLIVMKAFGKHLKNYMISQRR